MCPEKRDQNIFFVINMYKTLVMLMKYGTWFFLNIFAAKSRKRFPPHLNIVSTLPCETSNAHHARAAIELLKKLQNLSRLNCSLQIHQISVQLITACGKYCKRRCTNTHHWSGRTETATENGTGQAVPSLQQPFVSGIVSRSRTADQWCVFCTPLQFSAYGISIHQSVTFRVA